MSFPPQDQSLPQSPTLLIAGPPPWLQTRNRFRYEPLKSERDIRLLRVIPGDNDAQVEITLETANLDDSCLRYEALSYVWGTWPKLGAHSVSCDGQSLLITDNLLYALTELRRQPSKPPLPLWVDAISINQQDILERNQQVSLMGTIYSHAIKVLVYLRGQLGPFNHLAEAAEPISENWPLIPNRDSRIENSAINMLSSDRISPVWKPERNQRATTTELRSDSGRDSGFCPHQDHE
jgi:Heterokaryon incompatibility protein (HET)